MEGCLCSRQGTPYLFLMDGKWVAQPHPPCYCHDAAGEELTPWSCPCHQRVTYAISRGKPDARELDIEVEPSRPRHHPSHSMVVMKGQRRCIWCRLPEKKCLEPCKSPATSRKKTATDP
jgi:hypothetical protein